MHRLIDGVILEPVEYIETFENLERLDDGRSGKVSGRFKGDLVGQRRSRKSAKQPPSPSIVVENHIHNHNQQKQAMSNDTSKTWNGDRIDGDKIMGDKVEGNKMQVNTVQGDAVAGNKIVNSQNLAQAAQDIKALINQLSNDYDTTTPTGKRRLSEKNLDALEGNSVSQNRVLKALKEAGKTAFEEAIDHPIAKVLVAGLEGYLED